MSSSTFKLFHKNTLIGTITNSSVDGLEMLGDIELTKEADEFKPIFDFFLVEENLEQEPPFPVEKLWNWFVVDQAGNREEIGLPHIEGKDISWRFIGVRK